jgi:hypothetical protein
VTYARSRQATTHETHRSTARRTAPAESVLGRFLDDAYENVATEVDAEQEQERARRSKPWWALVVPAYQTEQSQSSTVDTRHEESVEDQAHPAPMMSFDRAVDASHSATGTTRVTPRLLPAARLDVASPAHGQVRTCGLARFFPAHTIHAQRSTAVVAGNNCTLQSVDHYHVHRVSVSLDPLLTDGPAREALQQLLRAPHDSARIADFQRALRRLSTASADRGPTHDSTSARPSHVTSVMASTAVQQGDGSRMNVTSRYVVEESVLPIVDLLAEDKDLVRSFAEALLEDQPGPGRVAFLRDLRRVCGSVDDLALLDHARDLDASDTHLLCLFGFAFADQASAVMIGSGNELVVRMQVDHPGLSQGDVLADLVQLRRDSAPS